MLKEENMPQCTHDGFIVIYNTVPLAGKGATYQQCPYCKLVTDVEFLNRKFPTPDMSTCYGCGVEIKESEAYVSREGNLYCSIECYLTIQEWEDSNE